MEPISYTLRRQFLRSPWHVLLLAFLTYLLMQMLVGGLLLPLLGTAFGYDADLIPDILQGKQLEQPGAKIFFRLSLFLNNLFTWGLAAVLLGWLAGSPRRELMLQTPRGDASPAAFLGMAALTMLLAMPLVQWTFLPIDSLQLPDSMAELQRALEDMERLNRETLPLLFGETNLPIAALNLLIFAATPAICEEFFFRGFLLRQLGRHWHPQVTIWVIAAVFSFMHLQLLGFVSRLILGGLLGYFVWYSRSIWPGVIAHFTFNATAVLGAVAMSEAAKGEGAPEGERPAWYWALGSALMVGWGLSWFMRRHSTSSEEQTPSS